eukprot:TRINITY_DN99_c0_g1_i1.p1 TRINITY_DN99_c0_g1~~TRINITY_DN99_c0_g1_i1.p1  ORF type:complete len:123 (-),score=3.26 TRINITY_DN99_c0_g1_i1:137-505(-)
MIIAMFPGSRVIHQDGIVFTKYPATLVLCFLLLVALHGLRLAGRALIRTVSHWVNEDLALLSWELLEESASIGMAATGELEPVVLNDQRHIASPSWHSKLNGPCVPQDIQDAPRLGAYSKHQ